MEGGWTWDSGLQAAPTEFAGCALQGFSRLQRLRDGSKRPNVEVMRRRQEQSFASYSVDQLGERESKN